MGFLSKSNLLFVLCCLCLNLVVAVDTIRSSQSIKDTDSDYIICNGSAFKLGFFSPVNSTNRYLGIWYNRISVFTVVWVANREKALKDYSRVLTISENGNLVVLNGQMEILWSSNVTNSVVNRSAQLLDSGNLVLRDNTTRTAIWEGFQFPTNTMLPKMKISANARTGKKVQLTSWKSPSDPSIGSFSSGFDPLSIGLPQSFIWKDHSPYWRSGQWNGRIFIGVPNVYSAFGDGYSIETDEEGTISLRFSYVTESLIHLVQNLNGNMEQRSWDDKKDWVVVLKALQSECDFYGKCGAFGSCNSQSWPICSCLGGFEPRNTEEWNRGNWSSGCVRRTPLQCERVNTTGGEDSKMDGFLKLKMMKVPDFADYSSALEDECRQKCLENCSCIAYAYDTGTACLPWTRSLIDAQKFSSGGVDLYMRVAFPELEGQILEKKNTDTEGHVIKIVIITVIIGTVSISICTYFFWKWMAKQKARRKKEKGIFLFNRGAAHQKVPTEKVPGDNLNHVQIQELPLFNFEKLASAANNFQQSNMLGQGGFGPVYWGKLSDGQEIAVKRLSKNFGQGLKEFMNEVIVISKLQHRNLVRLLGSCVEGEERMLIYEYMPNKSLDE